MLGLIPCPGVNTRMQQWTQLFWEAGSPELLAQAPGSACGLRRENTGLSEIWVAMLT